MGVTRAGSAREAGKAVRRTDTKERPVTCECGKKYRDQEEMGRSSDSMDFSGIANRFCC